MERVRRRDVRLEVVRGRIFRSVFFAYYGASGRNRCKFIVNTERKDQRGKEKQKESLYNLEFRSFFELENIGTAISRQEQIRNDSQAALTAAVSRDRVEWEARSIRKEDKSERWMPRLSGGEEGRGKLRKGSGNRKQVLIRAYPNGGTQWVEDPLPSQMERTRGTETS